MVSLRLCVCGGEKGEEKNKAEKKERKKQTKKQKKSNKKSGKVREDYNINIMYVEKFKILYIIFLFLLPTCFSDFWIVFSCLPCESELYAVALALLTFEELYVCK